MSSIVLSIFLLSIGASFIQRTTGFGFGIFIMTMLPFLMPSYGEATTLSGLLAITTSAAIVWRLRDYVTWQRIWPILLTFILVSTIAIFALTRIEDHILRRILGVALILISIYFMLFSQRLFLLMSFWIRKRLQRKAMLFTLMPIKHGQGVRIGFFWLCIKKEKTSSIYPVKWEEARLQLLCGLANLAQDNYKCLIVLVWLFVIAKIYFKIWWNQQFFVFLQPVLVRMIS